MAPNKTDLVALAKRVHEHQTAEGLTDTALLKKFPQLGSTKTFKRILAGDLAELDVERWMLEFQQALALIDALAGATNETEPLFDDLTAPARLRVAVLDAMKETGNARLVILQGPSGSGKTCAAALLAQRFGSRVVLAHANETWKDSMMSMLGGLLAALGVTAPPGSTAERLQLVIARLNGVRVCLIVDEAHHLGPRTLNLVKTLINDTPGEFVLLAMGTLFKRLEMSAYEEARQLTQNRLAERVKLDGLVESDVAKYLERRLTWSNGDLKSAVTAVATRAQTLGQFAYLKAVCRQAKKLSGGEPLTLDVFTRAMVKAEASR